TTPRVEVANIDNQRNALTGEFQLRVDSFEALLEFFKAGPEFLRQVHSGCSATDDERPRPLPQCASGVRKLHEFIGASSSKNERTEYRSPEQTRERWFRERDCHLHIEATGA